MLILILSFIISVLFGLNNGSLCQAGLVGSRLYSFKRAVVIMGLGLSLGALIEGWKVEKFVRIERLDGDEITILLIVPIFLMLLFTYYKVPLSLAHALTGSWLGIMIFYLTIKFETLFWLIVAWALTPFASMLFSAFLFLMLRRIFTSWTIASVSSFTKNLAISVSFYVSYVLGANNIGLIMGTSKLSIYFLPLIVLAVLFGSMILSKGYSKVIGEDVLVVGPIGLVSSLLSGSFTVWLLTQLSFPASLANGILGGILGIGLASKPVIFNVKKVRQIILSWLLAGLLGFTLSFILYKIVFM